MGLSLSLLLLAVAAAAVPVALIGTHHPRSLRDVEKLLVSVTLVIVVGTIVVHGFHRLDFFGLVHLLYLLGVVTVPVMFGAWFLFSRRYGPSLFGNIFGVAAIAIGLTGLYGTHVEPNWLRTDRVEVRANVAQPLRIGVVADLQSGHVGDHERRAIDAVLAEEPDLVVVPGDWYQGSNDELTANRGDFVALLRRLVEGAGLVAVVSGDSDDAVLMAAIARDAGASFIDDTVLAFDIDGVPVRLAGFGVNETASIAVIAELERPNPGLTVVVTHRPDVVYELGSAANVDLVIAGHTHGGQIQLPLFGPPVTFSDIPRHVAAGDIDLVDNIPLYVSAGVGIERGQAPQVRLGVRPEVGIVDVVPR